MTTQNTTRLGCLAALLLGACFSSSSMAANDEARLKSREFKPGKTLQNSGYKAKEYQSARKQSAPGTTYKKKEEKNSRWTLFKKREMESAKPSPAAKLAANKPYKQEKHTRVPTTKADARLVEEKKPYIKQKGELEESPFTPAQKSEWKNPLLKPRQGIKEPDE